MLWLRALHIITMVCWFAGIFYLPRLFVYHTMSDDATSLTRFKIMERKLYRGIMTPSGILTVLFGGWLILLNPDYYLSQGWLHAKLCLVLLLVVYHIYCGICLRRFAQDKNTHSHVFYRWMNEIPVLLLIAIVILAIVKPF